MSWTWKITNIKWSRLTGQVWGGAGKPVVWFMILAEAFFVEVLLMSGVSGAYLIIFGAAWVVDGEAGVETEDEPWTGSEGAEVLSFFAVVWSFSEDVSGADRDRLGLEVFWEVLGDFEVDCSFWAGDFVRSGAEVLSGLLTGCPVFEGVVEGVMEWLLTVLTSLAVEPEDAVEVSDNLREVWPVGGWLDCGLECWLVWWQYRQVLEVRSTWICILKA